MTIDEMLSRPLTPVADNGFSARVIARVREEEKRRFYVAGAVGAACAMAAALEVPLQTLAATANHIAFDLLTSPAIALAVVALGVTLLVDRKYRPF